MNEKKASGQHEETEKLAWQSPTIEELDYTGTEAIYNPVPNNFDGTFYTH
jgi:hypothetical protein